MGKNGLTISPKKHDVLALMISGKVVLIPLLTFLGYCEVQLLS